MEDVLEKYLNTPPQNKQSFAKGCYELCVELCGGRKCYRGRRCAFAHSLPELMPKVRQAGFKKEKCWRLLKGKCPYGWRCVHNHGESAFKVSEKYTVYSNIRDSIFVVDHTPKDELLVYTLPISYKGPNERIKLLLKHITEFLLREVKNSFNVLGEQKSKEMGASRRVELSCKEIVADLVKQGLLPRMPLTSKVAKKPKMEVVSKSNVRSEAARKLREVLDSDIQVALTIRLPSKIKSLQLWQKRAGSDIMNAAGYGNSIFIPYVTSLQANRVYAGRLHGGNDVILMAVLDYCGERSTEVVTADNSPLTNGSIAHFSTVPIRAIQPFTKTNWIDEPKQIPVPLLTFSKKPRMLNIHHGVSLPLYLKDFEEDSEESDVDVTSDFGALRFYRDPRTFSRSRVSRDYFRDDLLMIESRW